MVVCASNWEIEWWRQHHTTCAACLVEYRRPLNWSCKSNMAGWPVPGHEASFSNKCLTKFGLKLWHFWGMMGIFSLYHVSGTLKLTKIGLSAWPLMGYSRKFYGHDEKYLPGTFCVELRGLRTAYQGKVLAFIPWPRHNSCRKGVCRKARFLHGCFDVTYRSWDKSMNLCLWRNCTFPNKVHHQNLKSTQPVASCFPGPDDAPQEMCDFHTGMGSCYTSVIVISQMSSWSTKKMSHFTN